LYRRILVPVHGGAQDRSAIELAAAVSRKDQPADLTLVFVVEVPQRFALDADMPRAIENGEEVLEDAQSYAESLRNTKWGRVSTELLQARMAAAAIVDEAIERGADVIVLAAANRRRRGRVSQGETIPYALDHAPCDVIITRPVALNRGVS
jgi:nucleotide-binding universal stress UspA family protein